MPFTEDYLSQPPYIKLKLLRHARGRPWSGPRMFTVSFHAKARCIAGRGSNVDVCIPDPTVSERHALFSFVEGKVLVSDLLSSSGTYVCPAHSPLALRP